jgi:DNA-directed RNA polymerase III subunit RPC8
MFFLAQARDSMRLEPSAFYKPHEDALVDWVAAKYTNRVVEGTGLVVAVDELLEAAPPAIYCGDGAAHVRASFSLVVFRPFIREVLVAVPLQADGTGIMLSLGFFANVFLPRENLPPGCHFDERERHWVFRSEDGEEAAYDGDMRVQVERVRFAKQLKSPDGEEEDEDPGADGRTAAAAAAAARRKKAPEKGPEDLRELADSQPMLVIVSAVADGLGPVDWWDEGDDDDDEEEEDDEDEDDEDEA